MKVHTMKYNPDRPTPNRRAGKTHCAGLFIHIWEVETTGAKQTQVSTIKAMKRGGGGVKTSTGRQQAAASKVKQEMTTEKQKHEQT